MKNPYFQLDWHLADPIDLPKKAIRFLSSWEACLKCLPTQRPYSLNFALNRKLRTVM